MPMNQKDDALLAGINYQISGRAVVALDDACRSRVTHADQRTSELGAIPSVMILKTQVKMLTPIE